MSFINAEVDVESLPAVEDVSLIPIHKTYQRILRIQFILTAVFLGIIGTALIFLIPDLRNTFWWMAVVAAIFILLVPYYIFQEKSIPYKAHAVRDKDIISQKGWLVRNTKICPFNRVQNCTISSGLLERRYGLATLTLYTAGTEGADMRIPGLTKDEAESLRQFILTKINEAPEH